MERQLLKIANLLYINMQHIADNSLLKGKMGLVLFFYEYGRYTGNNMYTETADYLLDEIIESLSSNENEDLVGIGWGIQYVINNKFVEGNPDEVLSEIDKRVLLTTNYNETPIERFHIEITKNDFILLADSYMFFRENAKIRNQAIVKYIIDFYQNLMQRSKRSLPVSFLNICYVFLSFVYPRFIGMDEVIILIRLLNDRYNQAFADKLYNEGDLAFLIKIRNKSQISLHIENLTAGKFETVDSYLHYFIPELLYFDHDYYLPDNLLVDHFVYDVINNISNDNLSLNGLAGIGLMFIKKLI